MHTRGKENSSQEEESRRTKELQIQMGSCKKEGRKLQSKVKLRLSQKIGTLAELCSDSSALLKSTPDKA